jgi:Flp pilus assembly protein TadB
MSCIPALMFFLNHRTSDWVLVFGAAVAFVGATSWYVSAIRAIRRQRPNQERPPAIEVARNYDERHGRGRVTVLQQLFLIVLLGDVAIAAVGYYLLGSLVPVVVVAGLAGFTAILFVWKSQSKTGRRHYGQGH